MSGCRADQLARLLLDLSYELCGHRGPEGAERSRARWCALRRALRHAWEVAASAAEATGLTSTEWPFSFTLSQLLLAFDAASDRAAVAAAFRQGHADARDAATAAASAAAMTSAGAMALTRQLRTLQCAVLSELLRLHRVVAVLPRRPDMSTSAVAAEVSEQCAAIRRRWGVSRTAADAVLESAPPPPGWWDAPEWREALQVLPSFSVEEAALILSLLLRFDAQYVEREQPATESAVLLLLLAVQSPAASPEERVKRWRTAVAVLGTWLRRLVRRATAKRPLPDRPVRMVLEALVNVSATLVAGCRPMEGGVSVTAGIATERSAGQWAQRATNGCLLLLLQLGSSSHSRPAHRDWTAWCCLVLYNLCRGEIGAALPIAELSEALRALALVVSLGGPGDADASLPATSVVLHWLSGRLRYAVLNALVANLAACEGKNDGERDVGPSADAPLMSSSLNSVFGPRKPSLSASVSSSELSDSRSGRHARHPASTLTTAHRAAVATGTVHLLLWALFGPQRVPVLMAEGLAAAVLPPVAQAALRWLAVSMPFAVELSSGLTFLLRHRTTELIGEWDAVLSLVDLMSQAVPGTAAERSPPLLEAMRALALQYLTLLEQPPSGALPPEVESGFLLERFKPLLDTDARLRMLELRIAAARPALGIGTWVDRQQHIMSAYFRDERECAVQLRAVRSLRDTLTRWRGLYADVLVGELVLPMLLGVYAAVMRDAGAGTDTSGSDTVRTECSALEAEVLDTVAVALAAPTSRPVFEHLARELLGIRLPTTGVALSALELYLREGEVCRACWLLRHLLDRYLGKWRSPTPERSAPLRERSADSHAVGAVAVVRFLRRLGTDHKYAGALRIDGKLLTAVFPTGISVEATSTGVRTGDAVVDIAAEGASSDMASGDPTATVTFPWRETLLHLLGVLRAAATTEPTGYPVPQSLLEEVLLCLRWLATDSVSVCEPVVSAEEWVAAVVAYLAQRPAEAPAEAMSVVSVRDEALALLDSLVHSSPSGHLGDGLRLRLTRAELAIAELRWRCRLSPSLMTVALLQHVTCMIAVACVGRTCPPAEQQLLQQLLRDLVEALRLCLRDDRSSARDVVAAAACQRARPRAMVALECLHTIAASVHELAHRAEMSSSGKGGGTAAAEWLAVASQEVCGPALEAVASCVWLWDGHDDQSAWTPAGASAVRLRRLAQTVFCSWCVLAADRATVQAGVRQLRQECVGGGDPRFASVIAEYAACYWPDGWHDRGPSWLLLRNGDGEGGTTTTTVHAALEGTWAVPASGSDLPLLVTARADGELTLELAIRRVTGSASMRLWLREPSWVWQPPRVEAGLGAMVTTSASTSRPTSTYAAYEAGRSAPAEASPLATAPPIRRAIPAAGDTQPALPTSRPSWRAADALTALRGLCNADRQQDASRSVPRLLTLRRMEHAVGQLFQRSGDHALLRLQVDKRALQVLDRIPPDEVHRVGVLYVGANQRAESDILSNVAGDRAYDAFCARLGVCLRLRTDWLFAYTGGLDYSGRDADGEFVVYHREAASQTIFHVTTLMPSATTPTGIESAGDAETATATDGIAGGKALVRKKRHVGNDHVNVFWCEGVGEERAAAASDIIPGAFNSVHITLMPLERPRGPPLVRVRVHALRPEVDAFGPLPPGSTHVLPADTAVTLVRATALHADTACQSVATTGMGTVGSAAVRFGEAAENWAKRLHHIQQHIERYSGL